MSEIAVAAADHAERPTMTRWRVAVIAGLWAVVMYLHRSCIAPAATTIEQEFAISSATMGSIQAAFSWGYLAQVLGGILGGAIGNRATLSLFAVGSSLCVFGSAASTSSQMMWWAMFGIGVMQAGSVPCVSHLMKEWMPVTRRGISGAIFTGSMSIGASLASKLTGDWLAIAGWRMIFAVYAFIGLCWAGFFASWFRNRPEEHPQVNRAELELIRAGQGPVNAVPPRTSWKVWLAMLLCWNQWMNCGQQFFRNFVFTFFITGFPAFLVKAFGITPKQAGDLNTIPLSTAIFGILIGGQLIDIVLRTTGSRWLSRSGLAAGGHLICAACILGAAWMPTAYSAVLLIGVGIFFFGFGSPCTWAATMDIAGKHTSVFFAVMNTVGVVAGIFCPQMIGSMFDQATAGEITWSSIFVVFAAANLAAAFCWIALNSNHPARLPD